MDELPRIGGDEKKKADAGTVFAGIVVALFMLVIALGLLNVFVGWAFGWSVKF